MEFDKRSGIDLPNEYKPRFPTRDVRAYYNRLFGANWSNSETLNLSIGQGANSQTVASMAKFFTALANEGTSSTPELVAKEPERKKIMNLTSEQYAGLRAGDGGRDDGRRYRCLGEHPGTRHRGQDGNVAEHRESRTRITRGSSDLRRLTIRRSWSAVFLEFGEHGYYAARVASKIIGKYLGYGDRVIANTEGG